MRKPTAIVASAIAVTLLAATAAAAGPVAGPPNSAANGPVTADGPAPAPQGAVAPMAQQLPRSTTVTLLTGDKVRVDPTPTGGVTVSPVATGDTQSTSANFVQFGWGGDQYVIPDSATPYVATTLDPRLFDVSYLARAGLDDAHTAALPLTVTGTAAASLPGIQVAATTGTTATATVSKAQAGQFGHLLAQQWRASRTGASPTPVGTLPGISRIGLAPPANAPALPAPPPSQPATSAGTSSTGLHFHTVTINTIDLNGNPGTAVGFVQNVDDARLGSFILDFPGQQGPVSFSVPDGNYSFEVSVMTGPADDLSVDSALVVKPQVAVSSDTTITLDARTAVPYQPTVQTPPPAGTSQQDLLTFSRQAATAGGLNVAAFGFDGLFSIIAMRLFSDALTGNRPLYATPTSTVKTGSLNFSAFTELAASESDSQGRPRYDLVFPSKGRIPSSLTYPLTDAALTAVHSTLYASGCAECTVPLSLFPMVYLPWSVAELGIGSGITLGEHTDYWYSSAPDLTVWQNAFDGSDNARRWGARHTLVPGQPISETFDVAGAVPSPAAAYAQTATIAIGGPSSSVASPLLVVCAACRQDDNALLNIQPFGGSDPNHFGQSVDVNDQSTLRFWRNGTLAVTSDGTPSGTLGPVGLPLPLLPTLATYQLQWAWTGPLDVHSSSDTLWTFQSGPAANSTLPSSEECAPDPSRPCTFLPLLFIRYDLPLNFQSQAKAGGPFSLAFTVSAQQNAPAPAALAATVSVSYDDGATWSPEQAAQGNGNGGFTATITHPDLAATNGFVSLRIKAHDAQGNAVDQTSIRAYGLTN